MLNLMIWALLTGGITGGAWVAIVLTRRQRQLARDYQDLVEDMHSLLRARDGLTARLAELEERVDYSERLLPRARDTGLPQDSVS